MRRLPRRTSSPSGLDVGRPEIQALGGNQQRQRWEVNIVIAEKQRLGANTAIDIGIGIEVTNGGRLTAQRFDRHLNRGGGKCLAIGFGDLRQAVFRHIFRQRLVRPPFRIAEVKQHRQYHSPGTLEALGKNTVGIERTLGFRKQITHFGKLRRLDTGGHHLPVQVGQFGDITVAGIDLRLEKQGSVNNNLGLGAGQKIGHLCMQVTRPGPASEVGDGSVVDGDDRNAGERLA